MAIKECAGCGRPAVGQAVPDEEWSKRPPQLTCAECMKALIADGCRVELLEPRTDLAERVKNSIALKQYDDATIEGSLAFNLALDKLIAHQAQRDDAKQCKWDATSCSLRKCDAGCFLDARFAALTSSATSGDQRCGMKAFPELEESLVCDRPAGHDGNTHSSGWGTMINTWNLIDDHAAWSGPTLVDAGSDS